MEKETTQLAPSTSEKTPIEIAKEIAERIEAGNKKSEELLKKQEELIAYNLLAGRSNAGSVPKVVDPEAEEREKLNRLFNGTGMPKL